MYEVYLYSTLTVGAPFYGETVETNRHGASVFPRTYLHMNIVELGGRVALALCEAAYV